MKTVCRKPPIIKCAIVFGHLVSHRCFWFNVSNRLQFLCYGCFFEEDIISDILVVLVDTVGDVHSIRGQMSKQTDFCKYYLENCEV